ncbi:MAG: hypothetical protein KAS32_03735 [Candidatus Peribacteraceae bacterium]|nr:hypothetical protein [Candidatus Peribacteraceae bacterium]
MFNKLGYKPIDRYPVVARWNPTMEYTNSSISAFQPYVISGEVEPPENPLVIPQFCLRFNDIDNVGITESHNTGFVMIGQHMFVKPKDWNQNRVFNDIYTWLEKGICLDSSDIIFHEDAWAGGGNFGCCMEFFSRGCELGNQVYMLYEQTKTGHKELDIKVLDMGMGQERNAWFSQGCETIYDATFPTVVKKLLSKTGVNFDKDIMKKYIPHAAILNLDEVDNIDKAWQTVAKNVGLDVKELKNIIIPLSGVYSIGEHMRSVLFALSDGGLPSNVGGGYNLRMLIRRALLFKNKYGWDIDISDVCKWHTSYLKPIFPELSNNLDGISEILKVEEEKYVNTKKKSHAVIKSLIGSKVSEKQLLQLYDSQGVSPEMVRDEFEKKGKILKIPEDFYAKVSELHDKKTQLTETEKKNVIRIGEIDNTKILYYDDYSKVDFSATVLKVVDDFIILDKTAFYPTSGGQIHDTGNIDNNQVKDVFKQGSVIVHHMEKNHNIRKGCKVVGKIDFERRLKLAQQHTATHIINAAARHILGLHINQAGAKKTENKSHLDITHYRPLSGNEIKTIEEAANKMVKKSINIEKYLVTRREAERKFGMRIYQGGAVPGKIIRIVNIPNVDVEACGGTHLNNTSEVGKIKIIKTTKVQDGINRIEFTAGDEAGKLSSNDDLILKKIINSFRKIVNIKCNDSTAKQLRECSEFFSVPNDQLIKTIEKFVNDIEALSKRMNVKNKVKKVKNMKEACSLIFNEWKSMKKRSEKILKTQAESGVDEIIKKARNNEIFEIVDMDRKEMISTAESVIKRKPQMTVILVNKEGIIIGMSNVKDITKEIKNICKDCAGSGGGKGTLAQGKINIKKLKKK